MTLTHYIFGIIYVMGILSVLCVGYLVSNHCNIFFTVLSIGFSSVRLLHWGYKRFYNWYDWLSITFVLSFIFYVKHASLASSPSDWLISDANSDATKKRRGYFIAWANLLRSCWSLHVSFHKLYLWFVIWLNKMN